MSNSRSTTVSRAWEVRAFLSGGMVAPAPRTVRNRRRVVNLELIAVPYTTQECSLIIRFPGARQLNRLAEAMPTFQSPAKADFADNSHSRECETSADAVVATGPASVDADRDNDATV